MELRRVRKYLAVGAFGLLGSAYFGCEARSACNTACNCREEGCTADEYDQCVTKALSLKESDCGPYWTVILGCLTGDTCTDEKVDFNALSTCVNEACLEDPYGYTCSCTFYRCEMFELFAGTPAPPAFCEGDNQAYGDC